MTGSTYCSVTTSSRSGVGEEEELLVGLYETDAPQNYKLLDLLQVGPLAALIDQPPRRTRPHRLTGEREQIASSALLCGGSRILRVVL